MNRYRTIEPRIWSDSKFVESSQDAKFLWMYLLTAPSSLPIPGVILGGPATIAESIGWTVERFHESFNELLAKRFAIRFDFSRRIVWLVNSIRLQPPANPNVLVSWSRCWGEVPECEVKSEIWETLKQSANTTGKAERFAELFTKPFAKPLPERLTETSDQGLPKPSVPDHVPVLVPVHVSVLSESGRLVDRAWGLVAEHHKAAAAAAATSDRAMAWPVFVVGPESTERCSELLSRLGGDQDKVLESVAHVARLRAIQAKTIGHMRFFTPSRFWDEKAFRKMLELTAEQVAEESAIEQSKSKRAKPDPRVGRIDPNPRKFDDIPEGTHEL